MNGVINLLPMNWHLAWRLNAEADFIAANLNDGNNNIVVDYNRFILLSGKYQHFRPPFLGKNGLFRTGRILA